LKATLAISNPIPKWELLFQLRMQKFIKEIGNEIDIVEEEKERITHSIKYDSE
jgi:hypothetical protein